MTTLGTNTLLGPRRKNVHALLDPSRFDPAIDYYGAIYDSTLLSTRLMGSPEVSQHDYCFFYGKNAPANAPVNYKLRRYVNQPCQYACDKAIGELDQTDIRYVEHQRRILATRVVFSVTDLGATTVGECHPQDPVEGVRGCNNVIYLSGSFCAQILAPGQSQDDICASSSRWLSHCYTSWLMPHTITCLAAPPWRTSARTPSSQKPALSTSLAFSATDQSSACSTPIQITASCGASGNLV